MTTIIERKNETTQLRTLASQYRRATKKVAQAFADYIGTVGPILETAYELHRGRHGASWGAYCEQSLDCTKRTADRLRAAHATMGRLTAADPAAALPGNTAICTELARLEDDQQGPAWQLVVTQHEQPTTEQLRDSLRADTRFSAAFPKPGKTSPADIEPADDATPEATLLAALRSAIDESQLTAAARRRVMAKPLADLLATA